ncbi:DUF2892 domain-containing protein [Chryseobacterium sp.]|uniref:YgaP family membrane protein n=1 Tax=Chryseobacterium sp. TaxID=1871047 RepID=UPI0011C893F1|nr:DUF2892 domain-containing protein [Chryseobacterium sp.]TXF79005.1 DUF2892 domain-containing protein [Chryseobacterium sp.]
MKKNMGRTDQTVRILIAVIISVLFYNDVISGTLGIVLLVLAGVFLITGALSFCPLYALIGINTCPKDK